MVYGGRKNCSRTTYIPRNISVKRKNFAALSRALSLPSSHRCGRGRRKFDGGGPDESACRGGHVENDAGVTAADEGSVLARKLCDESKACAGDRVRRFLHDEDSAVDALLDAIVVEVRVAVFEPVAVWGSASRRQRGNGAYSYARAAILVCRTTNVWPLNIYKVQENCTKLVHPYKYTVNLSSVSTDSLLHWESTSLR